MKLKSPSCRITKFPDPCLSLSSNCCRSLELVIKVEPSRILPIGGGGSMVAFKKEVQQSDEFESTLHCSLSSSAPYTASHWKMWKSQQPRHWQSCAVLFLSYLVWSTTVNIFRAVSLHLYQVPTSAMIKSWPHSPGLQINLEALRRKQYINCMTQSSTAKRVPA